MSSDLLSPAYDNKIYRKYSKNTIKNKVENKLFLQKELGFEDNKKIPLICITCELTDQNWAKILKDFMEGILSLDVQLVVLGVWSQKYQTFFAKLAEENADKVAIMDDDDLSRRKVYAGSNISLIFSATTVNILELKKALAYGTIPIALADPVLTDFNPVTEVGNAFIFKAEKPWTFFVSLVRAVENYKFTYDWQNLELAAMGTFEV